MSGNVIQFLPADADWRPITEMDHVFDQIAPTLQRVARARDAEEFERELPTLRKLIEDFERARAKGARLTP